MIWQWSGSENWLLPKSYGILWFIMSLKMLGGYPLFKKNTQITWSSWPPWDTAIATISKTSMFPASNIDNKAPEMTGPHSMGKPRDFFDRSSIIFPATRFVRDFAACHVWFTVFLSRTSIFEWWPNYNTDTNNSKDSSRILLQCQSYIPCKKQILSWWT